MNVVNEFLGDWASLVTVIGIIVVAVALRIILKLVSNRIVKSLERTVKKAANGNQFSAAIIDQRIAQRSKTIASVFDNMATWLLGVTALVMILSQLGVDVGALIAVSTIVGAAIGFGAQTLVKDIISGIFLVFEDQYGVGDTVKLGDVEGEVVRVRLRVTEVRAEDGTLWYVRNGDVLSVGNKSQRA